VLDPIRKSAADRGSADGKGGFTGHGLSFGTWHLLPVARRSAAVVVAVLTALATNLAVVSLSPGTAAAGIGSDRTKVSELEQRIESQGSRVESLVVRYDQVESRLATIESHIAKDHAHLLADRRGEEEATTRLRQVAIDAYVSQASGSYADLLSSANATTLPEQEVYQGVASGSLDAAVATLQVAQHRTETAESALRVERDRTTATLRQLASAHQVAQAAIASDQAILSQVSSNLVALVNAANEQREAAEERAAARAAAAAAAAAAARQRASQPPPPRPAPGGYADPLRGVSDLSPERIDQGVDYSGSGPIYAVGDGVVLSTVNSGWPGGTFIAYRLTDGPANGLVVYAAEDIEPNVQVGQSVTPSTVLGQVYEGPTGIETGWADPSALGLTMAAEYGQFDGSNSTAFGYNFSQLLQSVGAPGGVLQNDPPTGSLPSGWPQW
jgi:murein DD-endopeptidase MepM/ murein hydrolase activator NlpD